MLLTPRRNATKRFLALALGVQVAACGLVLRAAGYPPEAARKSPPPGIEQRVLGIGSAAPEINASSTAGRFAMAEGRRHVLVFYRGAW